MLKIIIVEDNSSAVTAFVNYVDTLEDIEIVCTCSSAADAIAAIADYLPHAVILDLELQHGAGSGLDVLQGIKHAQLSIKPFVLITTINTSKTVYAQARFLGADYILYKRQGGYSPEYAINMLRDMRNAIITAYNGPHGISQTTEAPHQQSRRIRRRIKAELLNVGISPKMQGYQYLTDAIDLFIQEPQQQLTQTLAEKYEKTKTSVDKAMQNAIDKAWKQTDIDILLRHYKASVQSDKGVPTIMEFVCYYADKLREQY